MTDEYIYLSVYMLSLDCCYTYCIQYMYFTVLHIAMSRIAHNSDDIMGGGGMLI